MSSRSRPVLLRLRLTNTVRPSRATRPISGQRRTSVLAMKHRPQPAAQHGDVEPGGVVGDIDHRPIAGVGRRGTEPADLQADGAAHAGPVDPGEAGRAGLPRQQQQEELDGHAEQGPQQGEKATPDGAEPAEQAVAGGLAGIDEAEIGEVSQQRRAGGAEALRGGFHWCGE